jgi:hypothetical protein
MIKLLKDVNINVIESYDEVDDSVDACFEHFSKDEVFDADIVHQDDEGNCEIQFADGSVTFDLKTTDFVIV